MTGLLVVLVFILVVACGVLVYAAYPGRGRSAPGPAGGVTDALGRLVDVVAPEPQDAPPHGLLGNPDTDAAMRSAVAKVERGVAAPFLRAGDLLRDAADHVMPVDGGRPTSDEDAPAPARDERVTDERVTDDRDADPFRRPG